MKTALYNSILKTYICGLIEEKHLHGFQSESLKYNLAEIDRYMQENPPLDNRIDESYFNSWLAYADNPNLSRKTVYAKVSCFRQLMIYMGNLGIECFIPRLMRSLLSLGCCTVRVSALVKLLPLKTKISTSESIIFSLTRPRIAVNGLLPLTRLWSLCLKSIFILEAV